MKITKVDIIQIHENENPNWKPTLCRIYTDEGIYGDGEIALAYGAVHEAAFGIIKDFAKLIIGMNPLENEVIWNKLFHKTFWGQNGGPVVFGGISALDMALWDIKGKYFNVPINVLLGGKIRNELRSYASQLQFGWGEKKCKMTSIDDYVSASKKAIGEGYDCIKIDFLTFDEDGNNIPREDIYGQLLSPKYMDLVDRRLGAVREAVGKDVDIIMENHATIDTNGAIQLGKLAEKYNVFYFEEPCVSTPRQTQRVKNNIKVPVSQGERVYSRWQYASYFEQNSLNIIQPDIGNCGGITEAKKICDMAYAYDISVQAHVCAGPLSTAAALQLESSIFNFTIHEHHVYCLNKFNKRLAKYDYQPEKGIFKVPDLPGLGNEHSDYVFEKGHICTID